MPHSRKKPGWNLQSTYEMQISSETNPIPSSSHYSPLDLQTVEKPDVLPP